MATTASDHILCSTGAPKESENQFDRFSTSYELGHGVADFKARSPPKQHSTGYSSNFRAGVYYRPEMDQKDHPALGAIIAESFSRSQTNRHYRPPPPGNSGHRPLPSQRRTTEGERNESGYGKQGAPPTLPRDREARQYFAAERLHDQTVLPGFSSALLKTKSIDRDPVQSENGRHGPSYMSTEFRTRFGQSLEKRELNTDSRSLGKKTGTGFTRDRAIGDPITARPGDPFTAQSEKNSNLQRPIGVSVMHRDFRRATQVTGKEGMPKYYLAGSEQDTGFTRESDTRCKFQHRRSRSAYEPLETLPSLVTSRMRKSDPAKLMNCQFPDNHSSVTMNCFADLPHMAKTETAVGIAPTIGTKEQTGHLSNNDRYLVPPAERKPFYDTHYSTRFYDKNPTGVAREGFTGGKSNPQQATGFLLSTKVHEQGQTRLPDPTNYLSKLDPYVARSIMRRDPFFRDDPHTHKAKA